MLPEEQPVEYILEGIDAEMAASAQPKVILFDIGGVVVSGSGSYSARLFILRLKRLALEIGLSF